MQGYKADPGSGDAGFPMLEAPEAPKYWKLADQFIRRIEAGEWKPGDQLPSFAQMRAEYGASRPTAERVLAILERRQLIERRSGYGIFVARPTLERIRTGLIGLCGFGFSTADTSAYWLRLVEGVREEVERSGSQVLLLPQEMGDAWDKVDGALVYGCFHSFGATGDIPPVPVVRIFDEDARHASVVADEYGGARAATEHLLALGHRHIAYLHGQNKTTVPQRIKGYEDALRQAGIKPQRAWKRSLDGKNDIGPEFTASGRRGMAAWLKDKGRTGWEQLRCTALLCHNDETAIGALQVLAEAGYVVPRDISVVGFDGLDAGEYSSPRLTSIEMPLCRIGQSAVELLQSQIQNGQTNSQQEVIETRLLLRDSTAPAPVSSATFSAPKSKN